MRTLIRNQMLEPIAIPNNMISDYIIVNESRLGLSKVLQDFAVRPFLPSLLSPLTHAYIPPLKRSAPPSWYGKGW